MLRLFFLAFCAVVIVAVGYVVLPRNASRPDPHLSRAAAPASAPDPSAFVVHDAPAPAAPVPPAPASPGTGAADQAAVAAPGLDATMQRLRAANVQKDDAAPPPAVSPVAPGVLPPASPGGSPLAVGPASSPSPAVPPVPLVPSMPSPLAPPPSRWTSVTGQGARWRMTPAASGYVVSIDLGGGRVADVHVAPAFANLDSGAVNQRVDYLKQTILQNFPPESASYTFARDGSVALDR